MNTYLSRNADEYTVEELSELTGWKTQRIRRKLCELGLEAFPRKLYMAVTADKYEFPLIVADTTRELARVMGVTNNAVSTAICRSIPGSLSGVRYVRVDY